MIRAGVDGNFTDDPLASRRIMEVSLIVSNIKVFIIGEQSQKKPSCFMIVG
jgi:hypothetical protein